MTFAIAIIVLILFLIIAYRRLDYGLMIVFASLPLYTLRFSVFGIPSTLLEGMILILFSLWLIRDYKKLLANLKYKFSGDKAIYSEQRKLMRYPFDIEIVLVLLVSFIAMAVSGFDNQAMGIWKAYFFEPLLVYILVFNIFLKEEKDVYRVISKIIVALSIACFYVSVFAIYQKITGQNIPNELWAASATRRVTGFYGYPNAVGLFLGPVTVLMTAYLFSLRSKYQNEYCARESCEKWSPLSLKWFFALPRNEKIKIVFIKASIVLSLLAIYFAKSEGALIAIGVAIIFGLFFIEPINRIGKIRTLIIFSLLLMVILCLSYQPLRSRVIDRISLNDFSGQVRKAQWQETGIMLRDGNWFLGAGLTGFKEKIAPYHQNGIYLRNNDPDFERQILVSPEYQAKYWQPLEIFLYPHNIFLNFWVELGLLGLLLFVFIIIKTFYLSLTFLFSENETSKRLIILGVFLTMLVLVVHGIVDVPYFKNDLAIIFWIIISLIALLRFEDKAA